LSPAAPQLRSRTKAEDILIPLGEQRRAIRLSLGGRGPFLYFLVDRGKANLAVARRGGADWDAELG
jgi:hypothetical protein